MKYPYIVYRTEVDEHTFWTAESSSLTGCVGQGDTLDAAVCSLEENEAEWIATAEELDMPIPEVISDKLRVYSGKLTLRVSPTVHKKASELAKKEGISLNQYLNDAVVSYNAEISTGKQLTSQFKETISGLRTLFLGAQTVSHLGHSSVFSVQMEQPYKIASIHAS